MLSVEVPALIFLGCIGLAIFILLFAYWMAHKCLKGDFIKVDGEEADDEEMEPYHAIKNLQHTDNEGVDIEPSPIKFKRLSSTTRPELKFTLKYDRNKRTIQGYIVRIDGLCLIGNCPDELRFHIKLVPIKRKYKTKTKWKDAYTNPIQSKFVLGPLKDINDPESILCVRMYGRRKCTYRKVCLGEVVLFLEKVTSYEGVQGLYASLFRKSSSLIYTSGAIIFTSESESDEAD